MESDELSTALDDAFPRCPSCGEHLEVAGDVHRPHLYCPRGCRVALIVRPGA